MKRCLATMCVLVLSALGAGCDAVVDRQARTLVEPAAMPGQAMQDLTGTAEQMIARGRIDRHCRISALEGVVIDTWVIQNRLIPGNGGSGQARRSSRGTVVLLHPLLVSKTWLLAVGEELADRGWDVVLPDLRAHGRSGGRFITWGVKEKLDVRMVVDRLIDEGTISPVIYAGGASVGGCVAIQYAAVDPRCKGVLALAPTASVRRMGRRFLMGLTGGQYDAALARAGQLAGFDPEQASAVKAAAALKVPLIVVHGKMDMIVPFRHSVDIHAAAGGPRRLIPLPLKGHALEIGRTAWVADQFDVLEKMAARAAVEPREKNGRP